MSGIEAALASGVLKLAGGKLVSLLASEFASITGVKKDLSELQDIHGEINGWLAAVRDRSIESDPQFRWVMKLKDVAYDIDDLLNEVELEAEKHKIHRSSDTKRAILDSIYAKPKFRRKVAHKIKDIMKGYAAIVAQRRNANTVLHKLQPDQPVHSTIKATGEQTLLIDAGESKIPVRDQVKNEIVSKIVESNKGDDVRILSIVGLGGSGKTTLAQHICHDDRIKDIFKSTIYWVHVSSQEFSKEKLTAKIFEAITKKKSDPHTRQYMVDKISCELQGKKFLLVLDDAWHDKKPDWEQFVKLLNSGASGSMILLTTRDQNVAKALESMIIFNLESLTEAESWSFFLKSSGWMEEDLNNEFIQVGRDIVKKCGGVPLPIKTLGGVLRDKTRINTWRAILESNLWDEKDIEGRVFASLKLSYIHLEDHLKQCFTFCSIFPKGYEIKKDHLSEQWMAHGFIKLMGEEEPDDIGSEYFNSLVKAGFFIVVEKRFWPSRKELMCKMHDLIHDLARYCLQNEVVTSLQRNVTTGYTQKCRYLSLTSGTKRVNRDHFDRVRALYMTGGNLSFDKQITKSYHIRSIVVDNENFTKFPSFILKFEYLGYLEIHSVECKTIPEAISGFWNLQSLNFINCNGFVTLPESVGRLKKLRTLELRMIQDLESLPQSIGDCQDLQSLQLDSCPKMRDIPVSLGRNGGLRVLCLVCCGDLKQLPSESIGEFCNLKKIDICGSVEFQNLPATLSCPTLRTLDLSHTRVTMLPQWVTSIGTLECINLEGCTQLVELPADIGKLKRLSVLNIEDCYRVKCMPSSIGQLTRLTRLDFFIVGCGRDDARISDLENLDKLSGKMVIRNLKYLKDHPCDAEKASLKRKNNIHNLKLQWSWSVVTEDLASVVEQEQGMLNALEPPPQIEIMEIQGYPGLCLPRWMMEQNDSSYCEGITLEQTIPCQFLSLTKLTLMQIPNLKHMRGLLKFPSLKYLQLQGMANLEELWTTTSGLEILEEEVRAEDCFPALSQLSIWYCRNLSTVKPYFPPSLEKLDLDNCNLQLLSPGHFSHLLPSPANESSSPSSQHSEVPHLRKLRLAGMTGPSSGWEFLQHHTELETLQIGACLELTQLPESIRSLTSLQQLHINGCPTLGALPECLGELCSLRDLSVSGAPLIVSLPQSIGHLTSLTSLRIIDSDNLKLLPDAIQHLASLEHLELAYCGALAILPECIGQLSALQHLSIHACPAIECLPQSIQHLTALQSLVIAGCPTLVRRCTQGEGPDWHLVAHVPYVRVSTSNTMHLIRYQ